MRKLFRASVSKVYIAYLLLLTTFVIGTYSSYAYFTVNKEKKNAIKMITGNLVGEIKVDDVVSDKLVVNANETKTFKVELYNKNNRQARFNFYYKGALPNNVEAGYVEGDGMNNMPQATGVNLTANGALGYFVRFQIKVVNNTLGSVTIPLGYEVGLDYNDLSLPENTNLFEEAKVELPEKDSNAVDALLTFFTNDESVQDYDINYDKTNSTTKENKMYVFNHTAGTQQTDWSPEKLKSYRYIGADPNNYVLFNEEMWRIIGIETVDDGAGKKEKRIKLIRKDSLTPSMSFDNKLSGTGSSEVDNGSNDWTDSRLMMILNPGYDKEPNTTGGKGSLYWNRQSGSCPNGSSDASTTCNFEETGLIPEAQKMIGDAKWYLGGTANYTTADNGTANHFYEYERGDETCTTTRACSNQRKTNWMGKVGLMYPSDYGYATSGGSSANRDTCLAKELYNWNSSDGGIPDCKNNDWLFDNKIRWIITPTSGDSYQGFYMNVTGFVRFHRVSSTGYVYPVVYLSSDVLYQQGDGSQSNPFIFTK